MAASVVTMSPFGISGELVVWAIGGDDAAFHTPHIIGIEGVLRRSVGSARTAIFATAAIDDVQVDGDGRACGCRCRL